MAQGDLSFFPLEGDSFEQIPVSMLKLPMDQRWIVGSYFTYLIDTSVACFDIDGHEINVELSLKGSFSTKLLINSKNDLQIKSKIWKNQQKFQSNSIWAKKSSWKEAKQLQLSL